MERQHAHEHYRSQEPDQRSWRMGPNDKGVGRGVDAATTRKFYQKLAQKDPMKAGALHTILADG
eukprot:26906-Heterocapsa_arctica.AAC.1